MKSDEADRAAKLAIVQSIIAKSDLQFGGNVVTERKDRLLRMPLDDLTQLAKALEDSRSHADMTLLLLSAIAAFERKSSASMKVWTDEPDGELQ